MQNRFQRIENSLALAYGWLFSPRQQSRLEHLIVKISVASFLFHLLLVFLASTLPHPGRLLEAVGKSYLSTIYTPFSFILFYEALMLIAAIPKSTTQSIAKQFEIVSLIFIRKSFKDLAHLADVPKITTLTSEELHLLLDVGAGLLMFLLVTIFLKAVRTKVPPDKEPQAKSPELVKFIKRKEMIALGLTATYFILVISNLAAYATQVYGNIYHGGVPPDPNTFFYTDLFTVMIFTDVLIVILSITVADTYELVFRNEAFVIATILLRFSVTATRPYAAPLALIGISFGIASVLIYNFNLQRRFPKAKGV